MGGDRSSMQFYHVLRKRNYPGVRHLVLNEGLSVNHMFADGSYPIHIAAEKGDVQSLQFLLSMRASPDLKNRHGQTALMLGIDFVDVARTAVIEYGCRVNLMDLQRRTALHLAGARGSGAVVRILLAGGAQVSVQDKWGRTPLHVTLLNVSHSQDASANYVEVVKMLVDRGCDINKPDKHHSTPLFLAVNGGNHDIAKMLISRGSNVDQRGRHGLTPLALAAMKGLTDMCRLLVAHNCDVNFYNPRGGRSCLQIAMQKGHIEISRLLIAAGFKLQSEAWLYNNGQSQQPKNSKMTAEILDMLDKLVSIPPSLQQCCRSCIRECIGYDIECKVAQLQYPDSLKNLILLKDVLQEDTQT